MSVVIANYPIATDDGAAYERQALVIEDALTTYGTLILYVLGCSCYSKLPSGIDNIIGVTVGNEFILE